MLLCLALLSCQGLHAQDIDSKRRQARQRFEARRQQARQHFEDRRKEAWSAYAEKVKEAWKEFGVKAPVEPPKEERLIVPVLVPGADMETESWFGDLIKKVAKKVSKTLKKPDSQLSRRKKGAVTIKEVIELPHEKQPQPISQIVEVPEEPNGYYQFLVFGTEYHVRFGDNCRFTLNSVSEKDVAEAIRLFAKPQFDNMLYDCLQERQKHHLSDWAYYQMLKAFTDAVYGAKTNEATLALSFLFSNSGYKIRMAHYQGEDRLYMLVSSQYIIYNKYAAWADGDNFYFLDDDTQLGKTILVCQARFPKEGSLSLQIPIVQQFDEKFSPERTISSKDSEKFSFTIRSNQNYIAFLKTFPDGQAPAVDDSHSTYMSRWAIRANTPMEKSIAEQLYPQMRERLRGLSKKEAVHQLLMWLQWGLPYAYDHDMWGVNDRVNFAEESLYYSGCDCEDRAILLSRLVRDLIGQDVLLLHYAKGVDKDGLYYPKGTNPGGHMAMAVCFSDEDGVDGDYIPYNGRKFYVCDPTIIDSDGIIGETMYFYIDEQPTVVLLD